MACSNQQSVRNVVLLVGVLQLAFALRNQTTTPGCAGDAVACLKCGPSGLCMRCPQLIVFGTRQCVATCPAGHSEQRSRLVDYMGQVCLNTGHIWGLSGETFAVLIGVALGAVLCVFIVLGGLVYVKFRRVSGGAAGVAAVADTPRRRQFLKQLDMFRPHAYTFLDMLNDTRRQVRELNERADHAAVAAYRPVVRDLAKLLVLLNRPPIHVADVPADWDRLAAWAEKVLKRYKRLSDPSTAQVAQLISFLQAPPPAGVGGTSRRTSAEPHSQFTTLSTFKPDQSVIGSNLSLQDVAIHNFHCNYDNNQLIGTLNPSWEFPNYSLVTMGAVNWNRSREYLNSGEWLGDEFVRLGYRPQDEITTEL